MMAVDAPLHTHASNKHWNYRHIYSSSAHEEVVEAFASGQRRYNRHQQQQQQHEESEEREAHLQLLQQCFGRRFLQKALTLVAVAVAADADADTNDNGIRTRQTVTEQDKKTVHHHIQTLEYIPLPPSHPHLHSRPPEKINKETSASVERSPPSFRLSAHTSTEDEEIVFVSLAR